MVAGSVNNCRHRVPVGLKTVEADRESQVTYFATDDGPIADLATCFLQTAAASFDIWMIAARSPPGFGFETY